MYTDHIKIEREFTLDTALNFGLKEIAKFPYRFELSTHGSVYPASVARFKSLTDEIIVEACGKGDWLNSQVGAIYEMIQDYFATKIESPFLSMDAKIAYESSQIIAQQESLQKDLVINVLKKLPDNKLSYRYYQNLENNKKIKIPLFLSNVKALDNNIKALAKYSSDNGHAAGLSKSEALLHSINECIERDAFALLLYHCFYLDNPQPSPVIKKSSLPQPLLNSIEKIEAIINSQVYLLDMTNNINVAAVLCVAVDSFDNAPLYGMGASLYSEHAVERAVTELMQSYWLRKSMNSEEKKESHALLENQYRNLQNYPEHLRCTKLDLKNSITNNNFNLKEFSSLPSLMGSVSVISQVDILQNKIAQQGLEIFYCLLRQAEDTGVTVVHTIIPGLEYFWASAYGNVIAPFKRINAQMCSLE